MPVSRRQNPESTRKRKHDGSAHESGRRTVSKNQRWPDGRREDNPDQTPSRLHSGPSGDGVPGHRSQSPHKSNLSRLSPSAHSPSAQLQSGLEEAISDLEIENADEDVAQAQVRHLESQRGPGIRNVNRMKRGQNQTLGVPAHGTSSANEKKKEKPQTKDQENDGNLCNDMHELIKSTEEFARNHVPPIPKGAERRFYDGLLQDGKNQQLIRYIGCLAIGGPKGKQGWIDLLSDLQCRRALVVGILSRALKEHVFGHLYFGASDSQLLKLQRMEQDMKEKDGFERTRKRAELTENMKWRPENLVDERKRMVDGLSLMLQPFWKYGQPFGNSLDPETEGQLHEIVDNAIYISHQIRKKGDVVFYWPPTFKDEEFEPSRMECFNLNDMISNSPYDRKWVQGNYERAILREGQEHRSEAIVRVVCFPGLVAYRQHGGDLAKKEIAKEERQGAADPKDIQQHRARYGEKLDEKNGFRSKIICKSLVQLQWGKQRLLTREAGTSAHIDAVSTNNMKKYVQDSKDFVELYDLFVKTHPELREKAGK